jgi:hypothetical protein
MGARRAGTREPVTPVMSLPLMLLAPGKGPPGSGAA